MKFSAALVALCATSAAAFVPQETSPFAFKPLESTPQRSSVGTSAPPRANRPSESAIRRTENIFENATPVKVQGGSLRTFSFPSPVVEAVQVSMRTNGRPLNANVDLWQGPDNTPQKMGVYIEDARLTPFNVVIATPRGQNTVAIRNTAQMEFPLDAAIAPNTPTANDIESLARSIEPVIIQGGALKTYSFAPSVSSVQILLVTDGRPLNARLELLQGPNNNKQVVELYTEDGMDRPFYAIVETPGTGNVVRLVNTAPIEFPMSARVEPYLVEPEKDTEIIIDGGSTRGF
eukprot:CAMPEP_0197434842 /NCGR_PEP_ID=MMETSP1175-20131217/2514_1 /TAXON_ID=1003142 /ORGANISM="Triceratium dubium, Strain CCMP147" /LENGTH=289 /DNA_ID=CAMNT_0042963697 /DNA_START=97 /DNA_END=966 /DNA_ORIENTATION=+